MRSVCGRRLSAGLGASFDPRWKTGWRWHCLVVLLLILPREISLPLSSSKISEGRRHRCPPTFQLVLRPHALASGFVPGLQTSKTALGNTAYRHSEVVEIVLLSAWWFSILESNRTLGRRINWNVSGCILSSQYSWRRKSPGSFSWLRLQSVVYHNTCHDGRTAAWSPIEIFSRSCLHN